MVLSTLRQDTNYPESPCGTPPSVLKVCLTEHEDEDVDDTVFGGKSYGCALGGEPTPRAQP